MIARHRIFANALALLFCFCPQFLLAQEAAPSVTGPIGQRQVATMGQTPDQRARIICEGLEQSKLCQRLLREPAYRDRWLDVADKLTQAEWRVAAYLAAAQGQIDTTNKTIRYMIERAPKLPDGRAIFRAQDGRIYDENGQLITAAEAASAR